jgi:hypothetical protein
MGQTELRNDGVLGSTRSPVQHLWASLAEIRGLSLLSKLPLITS